MKWGLWSTTAGSNSSTPPDGWPEGQLPSTVNDCAREMMAAIRTGLNDIGSGYLDLGMTPTFVTGTTFTVTGNQLTYLPVGKRIRASDASTLYGTIVSASFSANTGLTVAWDSGAITASFSSVAVSVIQPGGANTNVFIQHIDNAISISSTAVNVMLTLTNTNTFCGQKFHCSAGEKVVRVNSASNFQIVNSANTVTIMDMTDAGAVTFASNVTAFSDERLKDNWKPLPLGAVQKMAAMVKSGTFDRTDIGGRYVGVGAQSLREIIPEAVAEMDTGILAVDYGPTALALCVELCREIGYLKGRLLKLENQS